jgi:hypothetical protein
MRRTAYTIAIAFLCGAAAVEQPPVTVFSPCECLNAHGNGRWAAKNDRSTPPADATAIRPVMKTCTLASGIDGELNWESERTRIENKWFALTRRVVAICDLKSTI